MPAWSHAVVIIASVKVVLALLAYASSHAAIDAAHGAFPAWIHLTEAAIFGSVGAALVLARGSDKRAGWFGGTLLLIAAPFADVLLRRIAAPGGVPLSDTVRVDAFLPLFFWAFLTDFPRSTMEWPVRISRVFTVLSAVAGCILFVSNASFLLWPPHDWPPPDVRSLLTAASPTSYYWTIVLALTTPGLPFLLAAARTATPDERRRVGVFVTGLVAGCGPISVEVLLETLVPRYRQLVQQPVASDRVAFVIFTLLATVPVVTAYSVLVDRVVQLRFVLRAALRYALARYTILGALAIPFVALGIYIFERRNESVAALLSGPRPVALIAVLAVGLRLLRLRHRAIDALDRRFFREQYDARQILGGLVEDSIKMASSNELAIRVAHEVNRALHLQSITLFVADENGSSVLSVDGKCPPLATSSGLGIILAGDSAPLDIDLGTSRSPFNRLPVEERHWLSDSGFRLLVPLIGIDGRLMGLIGLGEKLSGLPFSADDRQLLRALGGSLSLALENRRLRSSPAQPSDAPARECLDCRTVHPPETSTCNCGGIPITALVPYTLRGSFRLEQRIGAGGMGVVYRARDLTLAREVAIKTLPRVSPEEAAALRREARAMAALSHPNLAVIFGAETWRGTPLLVVEYLGGGTLADRLRTRTSPPAEIIDLGITLTDALEHIHNAGILHCDIKPSNIAFTSHNVPKLLDFGLAHILRESHRRVGNDGTTTSGISRPEDPAGSAQWSEALGRFVGTPVYMSPEAVRTLPPTASFDVWSLTVVLYEALAGSNPFMARSKFEVYTKITEIGAPDLRTLRPDSPEPIAAFFGDALSLDFRKRPSTAAALRRRLFDLRAPRPSS